MWKLLQRKYLLVLQFWNASCSPSIPFDTRMSVYNALVMPCFKYWSTVRGNIGIALADKIQTLQNRTAGILTFSNYEVRSNVLLDELGWERLETSRLKQLAICIYKVHNNLSPSYLKQIFTNTANVHAYNLRNSELNYYYTSLDLGLSMERGAFSVGDLFSGIGFPLCSELCPP